jgi:hypothetical protein
MPWSVKNEAIACLLFIFETIPEIRIFFFLHNASGLDRVCSMDFQAATYAFRNTVEKKCSILLASLLGIHCT